MNWRRFFLHLLRNFAIATGGAVLLLGTIGYLVAGREGMLNGATWGLMAGMISLPPMAILILTKYWSDFAGRYGAWYIKKETYGEEKEQTEQREKRD